MGTDTTNLVAGRRAGLVQKQRARWGGLCIAVQLVLSIQLAAAQPAAQTPPPADDAAKALSARVAALETLAKGTLPEIPIESLLGVSLDDDSSMVERDKEALLEHRRLVIALNQAERLQNKSEAELQQLRDQILAVEFERKVLALPIEVRERLVEESSKGSASSAPVQQVAEPEPVAPEKPGVAKQAAAPSGDAKPSGSTLQPAAQTGDERPWPSGWVLFVLVLVVAFAVAHVVGAVARPSNRNGLSNERREQLGTWAQLGVYIAGLVAALLVSFQLSPERSTLIFGALTLIAVLACKDVAASLLGGLVLFLQDPFRVGYRIEVGGVEGKVTEMRLLSVRVLGPLQRAISIPNSEFLTKHVSASPPSGIVTPIQVDFYIRPQDDIAHAKRIINEVIQTTRDADASKGRGGIVVSQVPVNGVVMVRLRTKVFVTGTHPEQEIASELSERVLERLWGGGSAGALDTIGAEPPENDCVLSATRSDGAAAASR